MRFSDDERERVGVAAAAAGLAVGAWVGDTALRVAAGAETVVPASWRDVVAALVQVRVGIVADGDARKVAVLLGRIDALLDDATGRVSGR